VRFPLAAGALLATSSLMPLAAQSVDEGRASLRSGEYEEAASTFRAIVRSDPSAEVARIGLMQALSATGQYEDAVSVGREAPNPEGVANATGEALVHLGRLDEAEAAFTAAIEAGNAWSLTARVNQAELAFDRGRLDEAMSAFDRFIDIYNGANGRLSARDLVAVGRAVRYLGRTDSDLFQDALRAFDEASTADPGWLEPKVRAGNLFLEKYQSPPAQAEFQEVLDVNGRDTEALLGMARAQIFDNADPRPMLRRVLEVNPNHVEVRALLAMQYLTNEGHAEARAEAERALEVNPSSLSALTALAASHMLADETADFLRMRERALAINPRYAGLDVELADLAVRTRRYREAVARAEAALALDSASWEAWGMLGINELRIGRIEEGRANLERAFEGDPYNPWFLNSLDLLDTFERYEVHATENLELFLNEDEADLLATYLAPIAEEAFDSLTRRYGVHPDPPVRAELFPSHADFSVRTLGEAGLGALGVSFGPVLVMDSPTARTRGEYNWASVFWHELAHSFHLAMTDNRVPRWFSEGLAVHEQRKARRGWGHQPTIPFVQALAEGRLKRVSELNDGFMRPDYPQQVTFSYYQASLVFQVIEERHGFDAIRRMLEGYREGRSTEELFTVVLGTDLEDFDDEFDEYLREMFASPLRGVAEIGQRAPAPGDVGALRSYVRAHPGDLLGRLRLGITLYLEEEYDEAEPHLREALSIFPEYGGSDSPYWILAQIHRERGETELAEAALAQLNARNESHYDALVMQADLLEELERPAEAATALDKAVQIWPYETDLHQRLAALHTQVGNPLGAVRERRAVVALDPPDAAQAYYELALAEQAAGNREGARRAVMGALEIAPNFEEALELLLALRGSGRLDGTR
jgi:tetratricopeptide (TPR) repeat protein